MSTEQLIQPCREIVDKPCRGIEMIIQPTLKSLGGFSVRRVLPATQKKMVGPWVFFDHMGPAEFKEGEGVNVRPHPHIGLATVTYLFTGEIFHQDSLGSRQAIQPGDINLMVAGKGIVHSERERPELRQKPHAMNGLQLWLALPIQDEDINPAFYHYPSEKIPNFQVNEVPIRLMMGEAFGRTSPVKTFAQTLYLEANLEKDQTLILPQCEEKAVYVVSGEIKTGTSLIPEFSMAVFTKEVQAEIIATQPTKMVMVGGENVGPRHIYWNFVSSQRQKIEAAKQKWLMGAFPKIPGDEAEYIPLPE